MALKEKDYKKCAELIKIGADINILTKKEKKIILPFLL
jgi:hypothetical protein